MRILVTGATSMIGRHVVSLLLARGDEVTVVQRHRSGLPGVSEHCCDLADRHTVDTDPLRSVMSGHETVVHLAAKVGVSGRWDAFEAVNVHGTERLINVARQGGIGRFVHISSPSVAHAGISLVGAPAGAADPHNARGHYARSKAIGEQMALAANSTPMRVVVLRPHLVWGPGDTQLVQRVIDRARAGRLFLVGSGLALIDTTFVDNAATAIVAGIDNASRAAGQPYVISNGQPRTVREILQRILKAAGMSIRLRHVPTSVAVTAGSLIEQVWESLDRQEEPPMTRFLAEQLATAHWFDQRSTQAALDWQPVIDLEEGFVRLAESLSA
ncbi:MAG: NAD-dependent epimerase/dehydratase family protein [Granulosicoccus sp.]|nr:NAD-dependent epimerase/dehydratase family protein [Granulosicoccus sp.]